MRTWASGLLAVVAPLSVSALTVGDATAQPAGYGAMPGGLRAPSAETMPAGTFAIGLLGGYGFRNTLLSEEHKLTRGIGDLAFAYALHDTFTLGLSFDGRYDKHEGLAPDGDDGYVGD